MSIERLTSEDELMLRADPLWPQDIGALAILDGDRLLDAAGDVRIDAVRAAIGSRLHLAPRFRRRIHVPRRGLGGPLWVDARDFDVTAHVGVHPLPAGSGETELLRAVEGLRRQRLDPTRPLWEMWLLPGLRDRQIGWFVRLHHAIADGMAAMSTIATFLDPAPDAPATPAPPWRPAPEPPARALLADNVRRRAGGLVAPLKLLVRPATAARHVVAAWPATRELFVEEPGRRTSLDRLVGPERSLALARTTIASVKAVARAHHATVNDVLLAATAAGLRALLRNRGEPVDDTTVRIYVPVSLRRAPRGPVQGNLIAQMVVPLDLGPAEPGRRLEAIAAETVRRKARSRAPLGTLFRSRLVSRVVLKLVNRQRVNVVTANIHGPEVPLHLAGARVLEVFPLLNLIGRVGLGVGAVSYAGTFTIGVLADRDAYPDLDVFVAGVRAELGALGLPTSSAALAVA